MICPLATELVNNRLGKEGPMPWDVNKNSTKYLKSTISVFVPKSTKYSNVNHFVINIGRRKKKLH